ncbi:MAG: hypothetical protein ACO1TE_08400 [Prosthecobacter sp.]
MTHTIHQFCKEFRYLRLRWCVFLAVVLLDLAVQMEWVLPMRPMEFGPNGGLMAAYDILMSVLLWMVAWWFMLSVPPEECASGGRGYALTRPLSRVSYWAARLLVWLLLVVLPLMLESAAYLWLNGRPWSEMVLGMAERAWAAGSMTLWLLPLPVLLRGWERYAVIVLVVLSADFGMTSVVSKVFEMLHLEYAQPHLGMEFGRSVQAALLVGLLMPVLALWHQRRQLGMVARVSAVMFLTLLQHGVAASSLFSYAYEEPRDPELIRRLTAGRGVVMPERDRHFEQHEESSGGKYINFTARARLDGMPEEYVAYWRDTSTAMVQNGQVMPVPPPSDEMARIRPLYALGNQCQFYPMGPALPGVKPPGLLSVDVSPKAQNMRIRLPQPAQLEAPVSTHVELVAEWMRVHKLGEIPIKAGAGFKAPDFEIELLEVRPNTDGRGDQSPGCVTVVCRMSARCFEWQHALLPLLPQVCLLSPKSRFMWQFVVSSGYEQKRGVNLGWCHMIQQQTFRQVLQPGTGVTVENLAEQRLVWLKPEYLGSSRHEMEMKDLKIGSYLLKRDGWPRSGPSTEAGNPREAFLQQVRGMPRPAEDAARPEIARYVAGVYQASHVFMDRMDRRNDGELKWPGGDQEACRLLAPFLVRHPDLFRAGLAHDYADLTQGVVHEAVLQAGIPGITRSAQTGGPRYERQVPVIGKPGQMKKRVMETLWLASYNKSFEAYVAAIQQHSDEPLWPLMDDKPLSTAEVLADYARLFDSGQLRWLMRQPDLSHREKAERLTREAFAQLPAVATLDPGYERPLYAAVALGMPEALDWLLRGVALKEDDAARGLIMQHNAMFASLAKGRPDTKTLLQFLHDARRRSAKDYRYDAAKMIWEPLPERP